MFFDSRDRSRARRRGVVLILILGMLSLMALIGVTFATFAGQSLVNTRNFAAGVNWPGSEQLMDYALSQLVNDTNNPLSAIRGHSLLRDMFGNDSVMGRRFDAVGATGSASSTGGLITSLPGIGALTLSTPAAITSTPVGKPYNLNGLIQYTTNIPNAFANPAYYGLDFTRWIVRIPGSGGNSAPLGGTVTATYEIVDDDYSASGGTHLFTLSPIDPVDSFGQATRVYNNPQTPNMTQVAGVYVPTQNTVALVEPPLNNSTTVPFYLDGRYMRAFNGPGMSAFNFVGMPDASYDGAGHPHNNAAYGNFLYNGNLLHIPFVGSWSPSSLPTVPGPAFGDPNLVGMDEDYDACDLENWFLALQSADGSVMIPSFHRPGILTAADWTNHTAATNPTAATLMSKAKILRPRAIDNYPASFPPDPSTPDVNGRLTYDIDNDGDGVTDSVWLDLGYPTLRDPRGVTFKPLFAFMVLGLNGRLPLNTAGNLQSRDFQRPTGTTAPAGGAPNPYDFPTTLFPYDAAGQNFIDGATWSHASHLGYSVNEINPMFALQNAPNLVFGGGTYGLTSNFTQFDGFTTDNPAGNVGVAPNPMGDTNMSAMVGVQNAGVGNQINSRVLGNVPYTYQSAAALANRSANPGIGVDLVQLRNLLSGTIPQPNLTSNTSSLNQENNFFMVGGVPYYVPDSMFELGEGTGGVATRRGIAAVPGRWGEPSGIPTVLDNNGGTTNPFPVIKSSPVANPTLTSIYPVYTNPVRSGKSSVNWNSAPYLPVEVGDVGDDDFDSFDFFPTNSVAPTGPEGGTTYSATVPPYVTASTGDFYDGTSGLVLPVERIRRFLNPIDAMGVGAVRGWTDKPPLNVYDNGNGYDNYGRVMFFRYFRPAGMPKALTYATSNLTNNYALTNTTTMAAQLTEQQVLNQPILAGPQLNPLNAPPIYDQTTNAWHGYQSMLAPMIGIAGGSLANTNGDARVAVASAMPYDAVYDPVALTYSTPLGYPYSASATAPVSPTITANNATMTSSVNTGQGPLLQAPDTTNYNNPPSLPPGTILNPYVPPANSTTNIASVVNGYPTYPAFRDVVSGGTTTQTVVPSASLNKDEADEMNLYAPGPFDMPFGPADLEWLYRQHDVDGAQLTSRLGSLAPVSFLNPQDGLTRRRMFSVDTAETINGAYAPDNPLPVAYDYVTSFNVNGLNPTPMALSNAFTDPNFAYNSRFISPYYNTSAAYPSPNASFAGIAFNPAPSSLTAPPYQNLNAITLYPNPLAYPAASGMTTFNTTSLTYGTNTGANGTYQISPILAPSLGSRDRKINLNYPLPVSNDPAEPVRQKWIRETYQFFKSILPPQAIDTPQELAQLSQYCVNIIDFRDPDCSHTRFVNTDLMVIPATATSHSQLLFSTLSVPVSATNQFIHFPFDPSIYDEQMRAYQPKAGQMMTAANAVGLQTDWSAGMQYTPPAGPPTVPVEFLVQHGMEYNPLALNEVLAYAYAMKAGGPFCRLAVEVLNTLTDDGTVPPGAGNNPVTNSSSDLPQGVLDGWDFVLMNDGYGYGRPDPITGELPLPGLLNTANAYPTNATTPTYQGIISSIAAGQPNAPTNPINFYSTHINGMRGNGPQSTARGAYYQFGWNTFVPFGTVPPPAAANGWDPPITQEASESTAGGATAYTAFPSPDATFPTNFVMPVNPFPGGAANPWPAADLIASPAVGAAPVNSTLWCWLYLRRPANPFDTRPYQYREMVTVDAIRFPFALADGTGTAGTGGNPDTANPKSANIFSLQRLQPYRGGHLVPPLPGGAAANNPTPGTCWGYSEQTANGSNTSIGSTLQVYWGTSQQQTAVASKYLVTGGIQHTFAQDGTPTAPNDGRNFQQDGAPVNNLGAVPAQWDYFPFNDRDFTGVAELMLVPGCPPGLFTKQFVENNDPVDSNATANTAANSSPLQPSANGLASHAPSATMTLPMADAAPFTQLVPRTYPYLVDKFFYSAASVLPPANGGAAMQYPSLVGQWTGDGWYKMFEFVEVPSSANGAVGTVAAGDNFDWFRQDTKPGLLNLNLIIDEEVFFGLMDDLRLNDALDITTLATPLNQLPMVVTQIDQFGYPVVNPAGPVNGNNGFHRISDVTTLNPTTTGSGLGKIGRGYTYFSMSLDGAGNTISIENHGIKAAFSDFLKLRSGGSGFLFAWGSGTTGSGPVQLNNTVTPASNLPAWMTALPAGYSPQPGLLNFNANGWVTQGTPVARERPFRSFSAPNVDDTILRPATLPPSNLTYPPMTYPSPLSTDTAGNPIPYQYQFADAAGDPLANFVPTPPAAGFYPTVVMDPGIRNPFQTQPSLYNTGNPLNDYKNYSKLPPLIPLRRLFQIPDVANGVVVTGGGAANHYSGAAEYLFQSVYSVNYNGIPNGLAGAPNTTGNYPPNSTIYHEQLYNPTANLIAASKNILPPGSLTLATATVNTYLGGGTNAVANSDNREHPYFRTELLQKVMNLTTVRTHQFAVWVTIGFFEVLKAGSPSLGQPDVLGGEIGLAGGKNIRYRSFFLLDRTRATGFDPYEPGDFRDVVVYRRRIE